MFLACGAEVTVEVSQGRGRRLTEGYIKLKINSCAFICIRPDLISLYYQKFSLCS